MSGQFLAECHVPVKLGYSEVAKENDYFTVYHCSVNPALPSTDSNDNSVNNVGINQKCSALMI